MSRCYLKPISEGGPLNYVDYLLQDWMLPGFMGSSCDDGTWEAWRRLKVADRGLGHRIAQASKMPPASPEASWRVLHPSPLFSGL